jgi:hypothetical protein
MGGSLCIDCLNSDVDQFEKDKVEYVLIGGFAVVLHGFPRFTQDIDIFVRPTEENVAKIRKALQKLFIDASIEEITSEELDKYPVIRYGTPEGFSIDLIGRVGEAFVFDDIAYDAVKLEGHTVRLATAESLLRMKQNTMREIDQLDAKFLREKIRKGDTHAG